jgi:signal transduction histidine kinase/Tfp pilus assembly protein PilF
VKTLCSNVIFLVVVLVSLQINAFAQAHREDSLRSLITISKEDTNKVNALAALARMYRFSKTDTAEMLAKQGLVLAEKIEYSKGQADCLSNLGVCSYARSNYRQSVAYHNSALSIREKINDTYGMAGSMTNLGNVFKEMGDFSKALANYQRTLELDVAQANKRDVPHDLINIATIYSEQGNYSVALEKLLESEKKFKENGDAEGLGFANNNLGIIYQRMGDEKRALETYQSARTSFAKAGYLRGQSEALINIGTVYEDRKEYEQSLSYYQQALTLAEKSKSKFTVALIKGNISSVLDHLGKSGEAEQAIREALALSREIGSLPREANALFVLAELLEKQGKYAQALTYAKQSEQLNTVAGEREDTPEILRLISTLYAHQNDFKKAFVYAESARIKQDSMLSFEKQITIAKLESKYQVAQQQARIELMEKEQILQKQRLEKSHWQRSFYVTMSVLLVVFVVGLLLYTRKQQKINQLLLAQNEEIKLQREEILIQKEELHAQTATLVELNKTKEKLFSILAHDLRAPLNSLRGTMEVFLLDESQKNGSGKQILEKLKKDVESNHLLLDHLLLWSFNQSNAIETKKKPFFISKLVQEKLTLFNEIYTIKNIEIVNLVTDELEVFADENQIRIVLHNLLSNAIKFTPQRGRVTIAARDQGQWVQIRVSDTGVGMRKEDAEKLFKGESVLSNRGTQNERGTGLGLFLCHDFIRNQGGEIWVESELGEGSTFLFTLKSTG